MERKVWPNENEYCWNEKAYFHLVIMVYRRNNLCWGWELEEYIIEEFSKQLKMWLDLGGNEGPQIKF